MATLQVPSGGWGQAAGLRQPASTVSAPSKTTSVSGATVTSLTSLSSAATSVASLFYLVPAVTALMAYLLFDEKLDALAIAGMAMCAAAVFVVNRRA